MSTTSNAPTGVLSEQLTQILAGRRVRSALFATYSFDPGFFELEVLPLLFEQPFDHREKLRRIQLEDALRDVDHVAVYYDRSALSQDAAPAQLDFRRLDVRRTTGAFHPKVALLLVDNEDDGEVLPSLIVGIMSANLTRSGWWENVETAHFEEINHASDSRRVSFRPDLLSLLDQLRRAAHPDDDQGALEAIHRFLREDSRTDRLQHVRHQGKWFTRLFWGQQPLAQWLSDLNISAKNWNLEIISPFFDANPESTVTALIDAVNPRETRILLPIRTDGCADVSREVYDCIYDLAWWSNLPSAMTQRSGHEQGEAALPRYVHAKVYRLWNQDGQDLALIGSVNLTRPAHSRAREGNLEAAFLVDLSELNLPRRWWLRRLGEEPESFVTTQPTDEDDNSSSVIDLTLAYDWTSGTLSYRAAEHVSGPIAICQADGILIHTIQTIVTDGWQALPESVSQTVAELLHGTSFLLLQQNSNTWRVLIREEGLSHRPSLLAKLTPDEILRYWSLLTPEQKAAFIETRFSTEGLEGLAPTPRHRLEQTDSIFDRHAGLFHAFGQLEQRVDRALQEDRPDEVAARVLGAKYDSLPVLLERLWDDESADPVHRYLTFLCAQQLWDKIHREQRSFTRDHSAAAAPLLGWLHRLPALRDALELDGDHQEFLSWYEDAFLKPAQPPEDVS